MGAAIARYDIEWDNMMERFVERAWRDTQETNLVETLYLRTTLGWAAGVVTGMLEMVHSQWKYHCGIVHKQE